MSRPGEPSEREEQSYRSLHPAEYPWVAIIRLEGVPPRYSRHKTAREAGEEIATLLEGIDLPPADPTLHGSGVLYRNPEPMSWERDLAPPSGAV